LNDGRYINEKQFCLAMQSVESYQTKENFTNFVLKIFKRYDQDKDDVLSLDEFKLMMDKYEDKNLKDQELAVLYKSIASVPSKGITYDDLLKYT